MFCDVVVAGLFVAIDGLAGSGGPVPATAAQIGVRGSVHTMNMWKFSYDSGMRVMLMEEVEDRGWRACIDETTALVGDRPCYVSFDIDSLDPAFAPGTGTPEVGGPNSYQALQVVRELQGVNIVGADLVEVSPPFDQAGNTAYLGASIMFELLCVMV